MKQTTVATDTEHLKSLIGEEIKQYGNKCDLNHINTSKITKLKFVFSDLKFNGDISKWDVSKVTDMHGLFYHSKFNGDISKWNTSSVTDMSGLFLGSEFNGDISNWNVSKVTNMNLLFYHSKFNGDISSWRPLNLENADDISFKSNVPYWFGKDNEEVVKNIESHDLFNKMNNNLSNKKTEHKTMKI